MVAGVRLSSFLFLMLILAVLGFFAQEFLSDANSSSFSPSAIAVQD